MISKLGLLLFLIGILSMLEVNLGLASRGTIGDDIFGWCALLPGGIMIVAFNNKKAL